MSVTKRRLTTTVDEALVRAGLEAVAAGRAASLSGWVNAALARQAETDQRLQAMAEAIATYEAERGEMTVAELTRQERVDRQAATVLRGSRVAAAPARRRRRTG